MAHQDGIVTGWRAALAVLDNQVICRAVLLLLAALASVVLHRISCRCRHRRVVPRRAGCPVEARTIRHMREI